ncbi:MAG: laccase domain-containing protein [Labilithrix sp.]|nr:laccase domain-containing protein [Labilithrix sp.]MCW5810902.1 laccase domain-containing protein [Labilithrix sp.]
MVTSGLVLTASTLRDAGFRHGFSTRPLGDFALLRAPAGPQRALAEVVGFDPARLHQATQVHGAAVVDAAGAPDTTREADALVATAAGDAVGVRVADCVPVLLADPATGTVAAVHAGWKGVVAGVVGAALARFADKSRLLAAIGPCIGACCFEVGSDVAAKIGFVDRTAGDKAFVDLRKAVRRELEGLAAIEDVPGCTKHEAQRFHSYRRDGDASGRLIGVIVAK